MRKMKKMKRKIPCLLLALCLTAVIGVFGPLDHANAAGAKTPVPSDRIHISSTQYNIVPGAVETVVTTNNKSGNDQRIGYMLTVDPGDFKNGNIKIAAGYKDYDFSTPGFQTVTDQAKAYENAHDGETVIAGINGDFYNMTNGTPAGLLVMDGQLCHPASGNPYFAILKDGTPVIRDASVPADDVWQGIGGNMMIVQDGKVNAGTGSYNETSYSRTAIGIKEDGTVVTYVTHGISVPTSCGETYEDVAKMLVAQGCVSALMLDGGGSSTYASMHEGTGKLLVQNSPSDGTPRTVSDTLFFVSTLGATGVFDHASLQPNNTYYTPTTDASNPTKIQFEAQGIDGSGMACDLPKDGTLTWALTEDSRKQGTIDEKTGLFTAAKGAVGEVGVEYSYNGKVVGETTVQLTEPDELYFSSSAVSLDFGQTSDLDLTVKGQGVDLIYKDGDFDWTVTSKTDGVSNDQIGTVKNNLFTAGEKQNLTLNGEVTVSYKPSKGDKLTDSIEVEIGKMPVVAMDFENPSDKDIVALWDWGASGAHFTDGQTRAYEFKNYDTFYNLWSSSDKYDLEITAVSKPWTENADGTVTVSLNGKEYQAQKLDTYGKEKEKPGEPTGQVEWTADGTTYRWEATYQKATFNGNFGEQLPASDILSADGYQFYVWHQTANPADVEANGYIGEGSRIVDSSEGEVRFGDYALKLNYDYRNFVPSGTTKNCNIYYRLTEDLAAEGSPTGIGMWVYAPDDMSNFWLWDQVYYWDGTQYKSQLLHFKPSGSDKTIQYTGINWKGWNYIEADLTTLYANGAKPDAEHPIKFRAGDGLIYLTYIPGGTSDGEGHSIVMGSKSTGSFYVDNVRFVYGTNVDDLDAPVILDASANDTALNTEESTQLDSGNITFTVNYTDPQGENYTGIDPTGTQLYLDGSVMESSQFAATADRAQTVELELANGEHTLEVSICDNFGNRTTQTYSFTVNDKNSQLPQIKITRGDKAELGGTYVISADTDSTASLKNIAKIQARVTYDDVAHLETESKYLESGKYYDDYGNEITDPNKQTEEYFNGVSATVSISSAKLDLGKNFNGTVRNKMYDQTTRTFTVEAERTENIQDGDNNLFTFALPVPHTVSESVTVPANVTVTFTTTDGKNYTVTTGLKNIPIYAYYTLDPGIQIAGAKDGTLTVSAADGEQPDLSALSLYSTADQKVEGTFQKDGSFTTDYFVKQPAGTKFEQVWVTDGKHYSYYTPITVADANDNEAIFDLTLSGTTGDKGTTKNITWFANPLMTEKSAKVQYMTEQEYQKAYDTVYAQAKAEADKNADFLDNVKAFFTGDDGVDMTAVNNAVFEKAQTVEGTVTAAQFTQDNVAAYISNVKVTGLHPGTSYRYRAGDGKTWSDVSKFSTDAGKDTSFVVVGDAQLHGTGDASDQEAIQIINSIGNSVGDVTFGLQTGDFVDGGTAFYQWHQILGVWSEAFPGIDFIHGMGNHESNDANGIKITNAINGLDASERDFYSVEYGDVYVAVINQCADLNEAAQWLVKDAAQSDCTWKVMTCHQPVYYTNPSGSSEAFNRILAPACDKAGINFVFNGHDHSYARTEQMKDGQPVAYKLDGDHYVDANGETAATYGDGTVYFIAGDLGEKSRTDEYAAHDNPDFHFADIDQDYDALYLKVTANEKAMTVTAYNMKGQTAEVLDSFTMYTGTGACEETGEHVFEEGSVQYDPADQTLICERCGAKISAKEAGYTGFVTNVNGKDSYGDSQYYLLAGTARVGFFTVGEDMWYANDQGLIDHKTETYNTATCTESGRLMAHSPRYDKTYTGGTVKYTGHKYETNEDGSKVCTVCGHKAIDIADWDFSLSFTSCNYNGSAKTPAISIVNPKTGEKLEFHTDGTGIFSDYSRVWSNNRNVGLAAVTITANPLGDYYNSKGDVTLTLKINPPVPTNVKVTGTTSTTADLTWDPVSQADSYRIYYQNEDNGWSLLDTTSDTKITLTGLDSGRDYIFAVRSQTTNEQGTFTSNGYTARTQGTTKAGKDISGSSVELTFQTAVYNGNSKRPTPTVTTADGKVLTKGKDYTVTYTNNVNVGTANVEIQGIGEYTGKLKTTFKINQQSLTSGGIAKAETAQYTGKPVTTKVQVTDRNGRVLTEGTDYKLTYENNTELGTATVKVSGINNYKGYVQTTFEIRAKDISGYKGAIKKGQDLTYTGSPVTPKVEVSGLTEGKDYTVSYKDNIRTGTAKAVVTGKGNYTGTFTVEFKILPARIDKAKISDRGIYSYTGQPVEPKLNIIGIGGELLVQDQDYRIVSCENNVEIGTARAVIEGMGDYQGTVVHEYEIQSGDISGFAVEVIADSYIYSGKARTPEVKVTAADGSVLKEGKDYELTYKDNVHVGTAKAIVTGLGKYQGTLEGLFVIEPGNLETGTIKLSYTSTSYSGSLKKPDVTIKTAKGTTLKEGKNYKVTYENNKNSGTAVVRAEGIGDYTGMLEKTFAIKQADLGKGKMYISALSFAETGSEIEPAVTVRTPKGTRLKEGTNYKVVYENNIKKGTATVTAIGINNYKGSLSRTFEIKDPTDITKCSVKLNFTTATYNGNAKRPGVTVKTPKGTTLKKGTNYTVTYSNNVKPGTATVTIKGIGKYEGTIKKTLKIRPEIPTNIKAEATKTTIRVSFARKSSADKYYIYLDGKYKGCVVTKNYFTVKNVKPGTKHKVSVKSVSVSGKTQYYSLMSNTVTISTKK